MGFSLLTLVGLASGLASFSTHDWLWIHLGTLLSVALTTLGVMGMTFSTTEVKGALAAIPSVYQTQAQELKNLVTDIARLAEVLRKEGLVVIDNHIDSVREPLFKKGLELLSRGTPGAKVKELLELESSELQKKDEAIARVWVRASSIAQWVGIVLGLIQLSTFWGQNTTIGYALLAPFYGLLFSQFLAVPWSFKLGYVVKMQTTRNQMAKLGVLGIQDGESPQILKEKLEVYLGRA